MFKRIKQSKSEIIDKKEITCYLPDLGISMDHKRKGIPKAG